MEAHERDEIVGIVKEAIREEMAPIAGRVEALENARADDKQQLSSLAESVAKCALAASGASSAAANAAELAYKAQARATDAVNESTNIVKSALQIHNASIATSVDVTVKEAMKPIVAEVELLKKNDETQNKTLEAQNETLAAQNTTLAEMKGMLTTLVGAITNRRLKWLLVVCACIGAAVGGSVAGYKAAIEKTKSEPQLIAPKAQEPPK